MAYSGSSPLMVTPHQRDTFSSCLTALTQQPRDLRVSSCNGSDWPVVCCSLERASVLFSHLLTRLCAAPSFLLFFIDIPVCAVLQSPIALARLYVSCFSVVH